MRSPILLVTNLSSRPMETHMIRLMWGMGMGEFLNWGRNLLRYLRYMWTNSHLNVTPNLRMGGSQIRKKPLSGQLRKGNWSQSQKKIYPQGSS